MLTKMMPCLLAMGCLFFTGAFRRPAEVYRTDTGKLYMRSDAPLELIEAHSRKMRGAIDPANQTFAWVVDVRTFEGFNSPLQREHFNENYLETNRYPRASFNGKIIEKIDFTTDGTYSVRAKGKFNVHGVEQERIIKSTLDIKGNALHIRSTFTVPLSDHDIAIPKIVYQKIAEEIQVTVEADLVKQK